jgi:Fe-S oxidoreductase
MPRPALRPMRALPLLEAQRGALETCTFCPKLCRSACPVSNAEPRETLTPWGKMSGAWMAAHGDVPLEASHAAPAWACTACGACSAACDHRNPVADVLVGARSAFVRAGVAPDAAKRILMRFDLHDFETRSAARALATTAEGTATGTALLVGCGYLRGAAGTSGTTREARDALKATRALVGGPVHVVEGCCGLPLKLAGDAERFEAHARGVAVELARFDRVVVVDAGCGLALRRHYPSAGASVRGAVELFVELAEHRLALLSAPRSAPANPVRWHDPCQLGRGLGIYDAPRRVLAHVTGRPVAELRDVREAAPCSGAGGMLPSTMPDVASGIADARLAEHRAAGGGRVVTGCASSLRLLRKRGRDLGVEVDDFVSYVARALEPGAS